MSAALGPSRLGCVFRSWIAVIDLFLEFGIEPQ